MARPKIEGTDYKVSIHKNGRYSYAATQPRLTNEEGKTYSKRIHWGTVDQNKVFHPNTNYAYAEKAVREKLVFPSDWDLSEANRVTVAPRSGLPECSSLNDVKLYGDVWLLLEMAEKVGLVEDLLTTFDGNQVMVNDILTIAMYLLITGKCCNRLSDWQDIVKTPSDNKLSSVDITRLMQSITQDHRLRLMELRGKRLKDGELCAIDTTSRSAYGNSLADIRYGRNKDGLPLPQTSEMVVYGLESHMPVYYNQFPGNMPDSRTIEVLCDDLDHIQLDIGLLTDRGFVSIANIEKLILQGRPFLTAMKTSTKMVYDRILELGEFTARPEGMQIDPDSRLYYRQWDIDYPVIDSNGSVVESDKLKLTLFLNSAYHAQEITDLDITIGNQRAYLDKMKKDGTVVVDVKQFNSECRYFKVKLDDSKKVDDYELDSKKVRKAESLAGFFAFLSHKYDWNAPQVNEEYSLRDEQEKYYNLMKSILGNDRQRNWSEDGKTGSMFILFVGLILGSYLRHMWKSTQLKDMFTTASSILDEMRSIKCVEHEGQKPKLTPFVGKQRDICKIFGFEIPAGCGVGYTSKKAPTKKRGRPAQPKELELD